MNTEELKALGLNDEQVKSVMAKYGQSINAEKAKVQADLDAKTAQVTDLTEQLANRDSDIKALKKSAGDNEDLSKQLSELQDKYKADTENLNAKLNQTRFDSVLTEALSKTKARDAKDIKALLDLESIKVGEDGSLEGLDAQISTLQQEKAYLFDLGTGQSYKPAGGSGAKISSDLSAAMKQEGFNLTEFLKEQGED